MTANADRLREHPATRFAPSERKLDLDECFANLLAEPHDDTDGHRQIAIARQGHLTVILFHFQKGSAIPEHLVDGAVTIHVLDGALEVTTDEEEHRLESGQLLILAPRVVHDVRAAAETRMLLTVHLQAEPSSGAR